MQRSKPVVIARRREWPADGLHGDIRILLIVDEIEAVVDVPASDEAALELGRNVGSDYMPTRTDGRRSANRARVLNRGERVQRLNRPCVDHVVEPAEPSLRVCGADGLALTRHTDVGKRVGDDRQGCGHTSCLLPRTGAADSEPPSCLSRYLWKFPG